MIAVSTTRRLARVGQSGRWYAAPWILAAVCFIGCRADSTATNQQGAVLRTVTWMAPDTPPGPEDMWTGIPKAYKGNVFVIRRHAVIAFAGADGRELWRHVINRSYIFGPGNFPTMDGKVFAATDDSLFAFDASTGSVKWGVHIDHSYSPCEASVDAQTVYVCSYDHYAAAYDIASGQQKWVTALSPGVHYSAPVFGSALSGDTLYLTSRRDSNPNGALRVAEIFALNATTGAELWRWTSATSDNSANGSPVIVGRLLVADDENGGAVFAIDRFTHTEQWRILGNEGDAGPKGTPAIIGDTVYVASADASVLAIHAPTGKIIWRTYSDGSYLSVGVCKNKVFANDFGLDVRDRGTGKIIDRVLASREDANYAYGGIGTDGTRIFVTSNIGTYAIAC
jgi:outer membrane protein assembly factor BamB